MRAGSDKHGDVRIATYGVLLSGLSGMAHEAHALSVTTVATYMNETRSFRHGQRTCSSTIVRTTNCHNIGHNGKTPWADAVLRVLSAPCNIVLVALTSAAPWTFDRLRVTQLKQRDGMKRTTACSRNAGRNGYRNGQRHLHLIRRQKRHPTRRRSPLQRFSLAVVLYESSCHNNNNRYRNLIPSATALHMHSCHWPKRHTGKSLCRQRGLI
jgi:hypothetical protein